MADAFYSRASDAALKDTAIASGNAAWTFDITTTSYAGFPTPASTFFAAGSMTMSRFTYVPQTVTIAGSLSTVWVASTGTVGANTFIGLYSLTATTGTLIASSVDLSAHAAGLVTVSLGITTLPAGWYGLGYCVGTLATGAASMPAVPNTGSIWNLGQTFDQAGMPAPVNRGSYWSTAAVSALPSTVALSHFANTSSPREPMFGIIF